MSSWAAKANAIGVDLEPGAMTASDIPRWAHSSTSVWQKVRATLSDIGDQRKRRRPSNRSKVSEWLGSSCCTGSPRPGGAGVA